MNIDVRHEALEQLARATGSEGSGLAGTVSEAKQYASRWTTKESGEGLIFFLFAEQAEQMRAGVAAALQHMHDAFDGFSQAVDATAQELRDTDESGASTYDAFDTTVN